jgi:thiol-disulfide isomerase/thioredoxin
MDSTPTNQPAETEVDGQEDKMMADTPDFFGTELVDASTGETFRFEDLKDKVVLVETMAIWCSKCLKQQKQVVLLHELLGERDDFASVGLDIDLNESLEDLKSFVDSNGFNWMYAVATPEMAREISQLLGDQFLNPPSTPMFIIDRQGQVHPLPFGIKSADDLQMALEPFFVE